VEDAALGAGILNPRALSLNDGHKDWPTAYNYQGLGPV
jgi:hypothetical protein